MAKKPKHPGPRRLVDTHALDSRTGLYFPTRRIGGSDKVDEPPQQETRRREERLDQRRSQRASLNEIGALTQIRTQEPPPDTLMEMVATRPDKDGEWARFPANPGDLRAQQRAAETIHGSREAMLDVWGYARGTLPREQLLRSAQRTAAALESAMNVAGTLPPANRQALLNGYDQALRNIRSLENLPEGYISDETLQVDPSTGQLTPEQQARLAQVQKVIEQIDEGLTTAMQGVNGMEMGLPPYEYERRKRAWDKEQKRRRKGRGRSGYGGRGGMGMGGMGMGGRGRNNATGKNGPIDFLWEIVQRVASGGRGGGPTR